jgi:hypothetical protein
MHNTMDESSALIYSEDLSLPWLVICIARLALLENISFIPRSISKKIESRMN